LLDFTADVKMNGMKYHMRNRPEREIKDQAVLDEILARGKFAALAMCRNGEPYIVTLSYGYDRSGRALYFHCAKDGMKRDFVRENSNVCATVVEDHGYVQGECKHAYRSVVVRGRITIADGDEKQKGVNVLLDHLEEQPEIMRAKLESPARQARIDTAMDVWRLDIEQISGKAGS
jgi:nitroimidazol reductase NimA-like FMN-containing flavoprotein (pyridoxamine 5'-phosphate oxidase superfamily)